MRPFNLIPSPTAYPDWKQWAYAVQQLFKSQTDLNRSVEPAVVQLAYKDIGGTSRAIEDGTMLFDVSNGYPVVSISSAFVEIITGLTIVKGSGSPEGAVTAAPGTMYLNSAGGAGTTLYVKETGTGNTGWVGK